MAAGKFVPSSHNEASSWALDWAEGRIATTQQGHWGPKDTPLLCNKCISCVLSSSLVRPCTVSASALSFCKQNASYRPD